MNYIVDFETSDLKTRCPIQVGIIVTDDKLNVLREFESLLRLTPKAEWSEHAEAVHGIPKSRLKNAPKPEDVSLAICGLFSLYASTIHTNNIVYHTSGDFDFKILMDLLMSNDCMRGLPNKIQPYNTLKEARKLKLFESYSLPKIMKSLNYTYKEHDALSDCRATLRLMQEIRSYE